MRRREFITLLGGATAAWPKGAWAQQGSRTPRVAMLLSGEESDRDLQARVAGFKQGLERLGWKDGRNIVVEYLFAEATPARYQPLAKELVARQPDIIIAQTPPVVAAVSRETRVIPIVFIDVSDPIGPGFVASLARPGGNLTGMSNLEPGVVGKWLAMLKEIAPGLTRVALVANPKTTAFDYFQHAAAAMAPSLGIEVTAYQVTTATEIESATESLARAPNGGLVFPPDSTITLHRDLVIALAARRRLPAVYPSRFFVAAGGLMSYSADFVYSYRVLATYIDRLLRGAKPAEVPVQTPAKFITILNLKTANALGLNVPPGLLVAADEVIE